ncbi:MAG: TRAM domain-containing protein [Acidobacteria bacterium]|nr:TRAM domain-containing protein [Acidobacteriota bacterium]
MNANIYSFILIIILAVTGYFFLIPDGPHYQGAIIGLVFGAVLFFFRKRSGKVSNNIVVGMIIGLIISGLSALIFFALIDGLAIENHYVPYIKIAVFIALAYFGLHYGWTLGSRFSLKNMLASLKGESEVYSKRKILDTSVIIDGRIADIIETGFMEGPVVIPQFVLKELQAIADSPDSTKRNRGRRGLNILRKMQKKGDTYLEIWEQDFPDVKEVDLKLLELAKQINGKVVTNDFNLNKVAQLRGVEILNINELANALKPVVLPGEHMNVKILREGKEQNQGVAYLDDGTMIVVDDARTMIDKSVDVEVTSVLQTTAGKMIFAKYLGD